MPLSPNKNGEEHASLYHIHNRCERIKACFPHSQNMERCSVILLTDRHTCVERTSTASPGLQALPMLWRICKTCENGCIKAISTPFSRAVSSAVYNPRSSCWENNCDCVLREMGIGVRGELATSQGTIYQLWITILSHCHYVLESSGKKILCSASPRCRDTLHTTAIPCAHLSPCIKLSIVLRALGIWWAPTNHRGR